MVSYLKTRRLFLIPFLLLSWLTAAQASEFSAADYDLYAGDFNHDGKTDLLYIGKTPDKPSGIALANPVSGIPQTGFQTWPSNYLNIPWSNGTYKAVVGDFNGDTCADILLQPQSPGNSYVLLANCDPQNGPVGQIMGVSQAISENMFGIGWSADQHHLIAGDFDGDGKTDLFFQATTPTGITAIVLAGGDGVFMRSSSNCWTNGPQQCWQDTSNYEGMKWSTQASLIYAGDFDSDGRTDLLVQGRPTFVMIDFDVPFPVPKFSGQAFGLFLAKPQDATGAIIRTPNQLWNANDLNGKWSPTASTIVIGDFNADGYADVLLQSRGGTNMLVLNNSSGQLQAGTALAGSASNWTSSNYKMIVGKFGGSSVPVIYLQSVAAGGTNYISTAISSPSVTASPSTMQIIANNTQSANGVGVSAGSADVTPNGTGRYSIPLALPRGTAGLTPELALQYQHSGPNGLLGVGWGLAGLSAITRCPTTFAQDSFAQGVQYLATDQYCLDGNRLRLTSGTQGAASSQYRTELETYSLIIAQGSGVNGPSSFEVWRKDGLIYEYGSTTDSQVPGTNGTRVWALSKIRDRAQGTTSGNYITFSYINGQRNAACPETSSALNNYRLCQITYAGNTTQGTSPPYTLQFTYQNSRNDGEVLSRYYVGQQITEVNRLRLIELKYNGSVVRSWTLGYDTAVTPTHASRISTVQECGENNVCLTPSTFSWSTQQFASSLPVVAPSNVYAPTSHTYCDYDYQTACYQSYSVDISGDGVPEHFQWNCWRGQPNTLIMYWGIAKSRIGQPEPSPVDLSGSLIPGAGFGNCSGFPLGYDILAQGKQGFLLAANCPGYQCWAHLPPGATEPVIDAYPAAAAPAQPAVDINGDGFPDKVSFGGNDLTHIYVNLHNTDGSPGYQSQTTYTLPSGYTLSSQPYWNPTPIGNGVTGADFDGDGRQDLLVQTSGGWLVLYANGSGFTPGDTIVSEPVFNSLDAYHQPILMDINGDGCTDLMYPSNAKNTSGYYTWVFRISRCGFAGGSGFAAPVDTNFPSSGTTNAYPFSVADLNGDGYQT